MDSEIIALLTTLVLVILIVLCSVLYYVLKTKAKARKKLED